MTEQKQAPAQGATASILDDLEWVEKLAIESRANDAIEAVRALKRKYRTQVDATALPSPAEGVCQNENCDFANMLWAWFEDESRVGKDGMRPERHEGLSSDDFKSMLDEHEAALVHDIERLTETNSQLLAQVEGSPVRCLGCGSAWTDKQLAAEKAKNPRVLSCCPERKPLDIAAWMARAVRFEAAARKHREALQHIVANGANKNWRKPEIVEYAKRALSDTSTVGGSDGAA